MSSPLDDAQEKTLSAVLAVACLGAYGYAAWTASLASYPFWDYIKTGSLSAHVANVEGFKGAVNVLLVDGTAGAQLSLPTSNQRWWGLVQDSLLGVSVPIGESMDQDESGIWMSHKLLFSLTNIMVTVGAIQLFMSLKSSPGFMALSAVNKFSLNIFLNGPLISSLYAMYYDQQAGLIYINYVPGWAFFWLNSALLFLAVMTIAGLSIRACGQWAAKPCGCLTMLSLISMGIAGIYSLFTVVIPVFFGYLPTFCWQFVDMAADQGLYAVTGAGHVELSATTNLASAFSLCVYVSGFTFWGSLCFTSLHSADINMYNMQLKEQLEEQFKEQLKEQQNSLV